MLAAQKELFSFERGLFPGA